jgi:hypothetical protein
METLKNNRFLHMKEVLARCVDSLVVRQMKDALISRLSIYQVGGLPGHSILEHLLTLKTVLARMEQIGSGLIFLAMDIISFFDKEDIYDCPNTLEKLEVNKKAVRMWYLLNRNTKISIKTSHGMTQEAAVGDCLGQGTAGAGLVSAANLDIGLQDHFNQSSTVMHYGDVRLQPLCYQDDVGTMCTNLDMAKNQADKLSNMLKEKTLQAHPDKSGILIMGAKKYQQKVQSEVEKTKIRLNGFVLKTKISDKYLGQIFSSDISSSALATVRYREGRLKGAAIEVRSIIEDYQMQAMGGLVAAWELWERALIPSLLAGAGTWLGDISETVKLCNSIQNYYWRAVLKIPESCPKLALRCEPNMVDAQWRIWEQKCLLLNQIKSLPEGSLAQITYLEAESRGWPGLGQEVRQICLKIGIPDLNKYVIRKQEIQKAIQKSHYDDMMGMFEGSSKLQDIKNDDFRQIQEYFNDKNLETARTKFKIRTKMLENIPGNFKNKYKKQENGLKCNMCPEEMTQNHCIVCPGRQEMRRGLDMKNLDDLVDYFEILLSDKSNK